MKALLQRVGWGKWHGTKSIPARKTSRCKALGAEPLEARELMSINHAPIGAFDSVTPDFYAVGWALDRDAGSKSTQVQIKVDGEVVDTILANDVRTDIFPATGVAGNHGFHWKIPKRYLDGQDHAIRVDALDSAGGASTKLGANKHFLNQLPTGVLDSITPDFYAVGWAGDPSAPGTSPNVSFFIDGELAGTVAATDPRPDIYPVTGYSGNHGYHWQIPDQYRDGRIHTLEVKAADVNAPGRLATLYGGTRSFVDRLPIGGFAGLDENYQVVGWAYDPDQPNSSLTVRFKVDGQWRGDAIANLPRAGAANNGFAWSLPAEYLDGDAHRIDAEFVNPATGRVTKLATMLTPDADLTDTPLVAAATTSDTTQPAKKLHIGTDTQSGLLMYGDQAIRLIGYDDYGILAEKAFNRSKYLSDLAANGLNFSRVWLTYPFADDGSPFKKVNGQYDLTQFNDSYFTRLHKFVKMAEKKGIVVQLTLFNGSELLSNKFGWEKSAFNPKNNLNDDRDTDAARKINPVTSTPGASNFATNKLLWQKSLTPLIERVAAELRQFNNVIYEIANEPETHYLNSPAFMEKAANLLKVALRVGPDPDGGFDNVKNYMKLGGASATPATTPGSELVSLNIVPGSAVGKWATTSGLIDVLSIHIAEGIRGVNDHSVESAQQVVNNYAAAIAALQSSTKPVIVSNDGDITQMSAAQAHQLEDKFHSELFSNNHGDADESQRNSLVRSLLSAVFANEGTLGRFHFEFLDKALNGDSWTSGKKNYDPRWPGKDSKGVKLPAPSMVGILKGYGASKL